jgi:hypothetical protein
VASYLTKKAGETAVETETAEGELKPEWISCWKPTSKAKYKPKECRRIEQTFESAFRDTSNSDQNGENTHLGKRNKRFQCIL